MDCIERIGGEMGRWAEKMKINYGLDRLINGSVGLIMVCRKLFVSREERLCESDFTMEHEGEMD